MIQEPPLKRCFPEPSIVGYKRSQNLSNLLVRAKVAKGRSSSRVKNKGFKRCERACEMCIHSRDDLVKEHTCLMTGQKWQISSPLTCVSRNVVYRITCRKCPEFCYIGETQRRACDRFSDHRSYATTNRVDQPTGLHFSDKTHTTFDMNFLPIEKVFPEGDAALRKIREGEWIRRYDSTVYGQNKRK